MAKERVLVVDDEEDILELLRFNLTREGYRVISTTSGEDAQEAMNEIEELFVNKLYED